MAQLPFTPMVAGRLIWESFPILTKIRKHSEAVDRHARELNLALERDDDSEVEVVLIWLLQSVLQYLNGSRQPLNEGLREELSWLSHAGIEYNGEELSRLSNALLDVFDAITSGEAINQLLQRINVLIDERM